MRAKSQYKSIELHDKTTNAQMKKKKVPGSIIIPGMVLGSVSGHHV
jgi:hypothetical protein